jgi:hypothetical protein
LIDSRDEQSDIQLSSEINPLISENPNIISIEALGGNPAPNPPFPASSVAVVSFFQPVSIIH